MRILLAMKLLTLISIAVAIGCGVVSSSKTADHNSAEVAPIFQTEAETPKVFETAVFAGGCFWGVEAVFENINGVTNSKSGYAGGTAKTANYEAVSNGNTRHAEAVHVTYDPTKVSYVQLLEVFFSVVHDPTQLNRQGPDVGPQYRSAIFFISEEQKRQAEAFIAELDRAKAWPRPIVTQVVPLEKFYDAEGYHQNYLVRNPTQPYIVQHDLPKLEELRKRYPGLAKK